MHRLRNYSASSILRRLVVLGLLLATVTFPVRAQYGTRNAEWPFIGGDAGSTKYSPLDLIHRDNVNKLRIAWRWKAENFGPRPEFNYEATPIMIGGVLYTTAGTRRNVVAIDGASGETLWMFRYPEGTRGDMAPVRPASGRGVAYWSDGTEDRILHVTPGYHLIALNAKTGRPISGFGDKGVVDLFEGLDQAMVPQPGQIGLNSPAMVVGDVVVVGAAHGGAKSKEFITGYVRGYDVRTGKRVWVFHTIPRPGEVGNETWLDDSWSYTGNVGVWAPMSADLELGYVYLPIETPTNDYYGGHRPGDNLFAESLVCLDAKTGKRVWHYQMVHHGIWDYDLPTAPILLDVVVNGAKIKAVAQVTKQAFTYVLDRLTGKPVWPIEERPVPQSAVPGERTSPTQPFPTKPPSFDRQGITADDLIDFTPELRQEALKIAAQYTTGPLYTPPTVAGAGGSRGTLTVPSAIGGAGWQGGVADPETGILYVSSLTAANVTALTNDPKRSSMNFIGGGESGGPRQAGPRIPGDGLGPQGLPLLKPPYGRIVAIDLNKGDHLWTVANSDTPEAIKNHPALRGVALPRTGTPEHSGLLVTKTLLFAGEGAALFGTAARYGGGGPMFRAYDKKTGEIISEFKLPGNQSGMPMTYMVGGRQYIVLAIGAVGQPAELVALTVD